MKDVLDLLREKGIHPTHQRLAVAKFVLHTDLHPTADEVYSQVRRDCPTLSRATVYNTLNLLVEQGLLRAQNLGGDALVFDAFLERHHHLIEDETGKVYDIPLGAVQIQGHDHLDGFEVTGYQVIMRGRLKKSPR